MGHSVLRPGYIDDTRQERVEEICRKACMQAGKNFMGSMEIFGVTEGEYTRFPPQAAEQEFTGIYSQYPKIFNAHMKVIPNEHDRLLDIARNYPPGINKLKK